MDTSSQTVLITELQALKEENAKLKAELAELRRFIYGQRTERYVPVKHPLQQAMDFETDEAPAVPERKGRPFFLRL